MTAFFVRLIKHKLALKKHGEIVSETYLLRLTKLIISGKHKTLTDVFTDMRRMAGVTGAQRLLQICKTL